MPYDLDNRKRVRQIARSVLDAQLGVLAAARALTALLHRDRGIVSEEDFNLFRGVESETDDLPLGKVREEWRADALIEKDREIARCEALWRDQVLAACTRILLSTGEIEPD
jgi:hypothetical protein